MSSIWTTIIALFSSAAAFFTTPLGVALGTGVGALVTGVIAWFAKQKANQAAAQTAEQGAITQHQDDGAQSVADSNSDDAQNADLDQQANEIDNPTPVVVSQNPVQPDKQGGKP